MKTTLIASAALALVLSTSAAFAQNNAEPGGQGEELQTRFTVENVMRDDPFGDIEVDMAVVGDQLRTWSEGLDEPQRAEMMERCGVIGGNQTNYDASAVNFCNEFTSTNPGQDQ